MNCTLSKARCPVVAVSVAVLCLAFLVPDALGDGFDSPRVQSTSGVAPPEVGCNGVKVLVMRPGNIPSCVSEATAQRMSWPVFVRSFTVPDTGADDVTSDGANTVDTKSTSTKTHPYPPITGTVYFQDLERIKNPGDMYSNAYTEEEARITAQHIADVLGYKISVDPDDYDSEFEYVHIDANRLFYLLVDENGDHIGNLLTNKVFYNEEMNRGSLHGHIHVSMFVDTTTHEERIKFITNVVQKYYIHGLEEFDPTQLAYYRTLNAQRSGLKDLTLDESGTSPENFARFQSIVKDRPPYATIVDDKLVITDHSTYDIEYWAVLAGGPTGTFKFTTNGVTFQLDQNISDETREQLQWRISKEEAYQIIYDFLTTTPIFNDERYGCSNFKFDIDPSDVDQANISGVPFYRIYSPTYCDTGGYEPRQKPSKTIHVDGLTGQFLNIGKSFGQCYGYAEDKCVLDSDGYPKFRVGDCWCWSPSGNGDCTHTPAYKVAGRVDRCES